MALDAAEKPVRRAGCITLLFFFLAYPVMFGISWFTSLHLVSGSTRHSMMAVNEFTPELCVRLAIMFAAVAGLGLWVAIRGIRAGRACPKSKSLSTCWLGALVHGFALVVAIVLFVQSYL